MTAVAALVALIAAVVAVVVVTVAEAFPPFPFLAAAAAAATEGGSKPTTAESGLGALLEAARESAASTVEAGGLGGKWRCCVFFE